MKKMNKKIIALAVLSLALMTTGITYAYLTSQTQQNVNNFNGAAAKVNISVVENGKDHEDASNLTEDYNKININETISKEVKIKNLTSKDYPTADTYIRVKMVPMIIHDQTGDSLGKQVDLTYNLGNSKLWVYDQENDTYYYTEKVAPGKETEILLKSVTLKSKIPTGYHLELNVMADGIAAYPENNLNEAWGLHFDENTNSYFNFQ